MSSSPSGPEKKARDVCVTCHKLSRTPGDPGWQVAPVHVDEGVDAAGALYAREAPEHAGWSHPGRELPGRATTGVPDSKTSETIAMPEIKICRDCHVSARPAEHIEGKIASDCAMCHSFHFGEATVVR